MNLHRPDTRSEPIPVMLRDMMPSTDPSSAPPTMPGDLPRPAMERRRRAIGFGALIAAVLIATLLTGVVIGRAGAAVAGDGTPTASGSATGELALISEAWDTIHREYVDRANLDDRALAYGALSGMAQAVGDTGHTAFLTPEELQARHNELAGSYVGIGVRVEAAEDGRPRIVGVFDGSPAQAAGILLGDVISAVDGRTSTGVAMDTVLGWVRGEAGTEVKVSLQTGGTGPERTLAITRADVPVAPVSWTMVPGGRTAFLRLEQFSTGAADQVVTALKAIREAGADRLVLDLRGNPGGYVNEAVGVASQFISSGDVYVERDASGHETHHAVSPGGVAVDLPLVVLVDAGTASSSEIVSGALQDAKRATVVGVRTYGTGTVLGEFPLRDGSALRIGTVEWLTPNGRRIWHAGITPDLVVTRAADVAPTIPDDVRGMTPAAVDAMKDPQLLKALEIVSELK